jgi:hypothetical protein
VAAIFLSHSSQDNEPAARLKTWLAEIGFTEVFLDFDKHAGIPLGSPWESRLYREIERCHAVLLLLTRNWLESKWCFAEFAQARALGKTIFVVIEAPRGETAIAGDLQVCDLLADPEGGRERLRLALHEALLVAQAGFPFARDRAPYPGLVSFEAPDAAVFFGRDAEIVGIYEWVRAERSRRKKVLIIAGGSGAGKSSLLKAGALPRLQRDRDHSGAAEFLVPPPVRPGGTPFYDLWAALRTLDAGLALADLEAAATPARLRALIERLRDAAGAHRATLVLAIDQAEELFTAADRREAAQFATLLGALAAGDMPVRLLLTLRTDHLDKVQAIPGFAEAIEIFPVAPLPIERLPEIVKGPARRVDLSVDDGLIEAIRADATGQDALPLVAFVLRELWDRSGRRSLRLEREHYEALRQRELSPLEAAVRRKAEETIGGAGATALAALREAFVPGLVRVNEDGAFARRRAPRAALPPAALPLIEMLVDARLLVERVGPASETRIEVAHEALFRVWPMLAQWLAEEREFLIGKSRIERLHEDYLRLPERQRAQALLSGILLERARRWLDAAPGRFSRDETAFIRRSARRARLRQHMRTAAVAAVLLLAVVATGFGIVATGAAQRAVASREAARGLADSLIEFIAGDLRRSEGVTVATVDRTLQGLDTMIGAIAEKEDDAGSAVGIVDRFGQGVLRRLLGLPEAEDSAARLERTRATMLQQFGQTYHEAARDRARARTQAEASLAIRQHLYATRPSPDLASELAASHQLLSDLERADGEQAAGNKDAASAREHFARAQAHAEAALTLRRPLYAAEPTRLDWGRGVVTALTRLGDLALKTPDGREEARRLYVEAQTITYELVRAEPKNREYIRELGWSFRKIGDLNMYGREYAVALPAYESETCVRFYLLRLDGTDRLWREDFGYALAKLAGARLALDDRAGARDAYMEALLDRRWLADRDPDNQGYQEQYAATLNALARLHQGMGEAVLAYAFAEAELDWRQRIAHRFPKPHTARRAAELEQAQVAARERLGEAVVALGGAGALARIGLEMARFESRLLELEQARAGCWTALLPAAEPDTAAPAR